MSLVLTVAELPEFIRNADRLLNDSERQDIILSRQSPNQTATQYIGHFCHPGLEPGSTSR